MPLHLRLMSGLVEKRQLLLMMHLKQFQWTLLLLLMITAPLKQLPMTTAPLKIMLRPLLRAMTPPQQEPQITMVHLL